MRLRGAHGSSGVVPIAWNVCCPRQALFAARVATAAMGGCMDTVFAGVDVVSVAGRAGRG